MFVVGGGGLMGLGVCRVLMLIVWFVQGIKQFVRHVKMVLEWVKAFVSVALSAIVSDVTKTKMSALPVPPVSHLKTVSV